MTTCTTCKREYDETVPAAVEYHTESRNCSNTHGCSRFHGKPKCYMCTATACFCSDH